MKKKGIMLVEEVGFKPTVKKKNMGENKNDIQKNDKKEERK